MQELRLVLIIVGLLAIGALLFHGLWTSKKEGKAKFGNKPMGKLDDSDSDEDLNLRETRGFAPEDDYEIIRKDPKPSSLKESREAETSFDPLVGDLPDEHDDPMPTFSAIDETPVSEPPFASQQVQELETAEPEPSVELEEVPEPVAEAPQEPEMEVIVLNVHCSGSEPFVGTKLFDSMQQNGLLYGEMDIFHRHADLSGTGKVLFSVANMMQPGTLKHDDPETFTTKGISFFMTLPCFGEAEQNFKLMLKTAQQIADDLGGQVMDDKRVFITPDKIDAYKEQVRNFVQRQKQSQASV
ncbi:cell division protein ZipA [Vibrio sp. SCSIO 43136]|uniref:cell division protein ZipA n=1 Tax=Vibrio sp. SCSIO 43136 TaxID=2819101 RepID=UPI00207606B5|nr:cell division protein ZipA [Vibrio sp. SCSIO 43136]USD64589.1 cell division protein ZipA [Vibrio sp. SCSIO 43136]